MSIMAESNLYESATEDEGLSEKLCLEVYESSGQFIYMPKIENDVDDSMFEVSDDIENEKNGILNDDAEDSYCKSEQTSIYYDESLHACKEVEIDYKSSLSPMMFSEPKTDDEWEENNQCNLAMDTSFEENQLPESCNNEADNDDDSDEETIATFLTAAGQRLALYAVEDSDEVFAVAVYDESGEPPTNFQFLMKSDVERLIGEGAVRTVKKPTQMKKQLLTDEPPLFARRGEESCEESELDDNEAITSSDYREKNYDTHDVMKQNSCTESTRIFESPIQKSSPLPNADNQSNVHRVMAKKTSMIQPSFSPVQGGASYSAVMKKEVISTNENEFLEQSTVNNLFMDNEISDDELTYADIEATLKNFRKNEKIVSDTSASNSPVTSFQMDNSFDNEPCIIARGITKIVDEPDDTSSLNNSTIEEKLTVIAINATSKNPKNTNLPRKTQASSSLLCRRQNSLKTKPRTGTSLLIGNNQPRATIKTDQQTETTSMSPKAKRPRKQQLTTVNRGDSEIIIQPATFTSEDDEKTKKKTRKKRKTGRVYKTKGSVIKRLRRTRRKRVKPAVEVIEIDVDEEDRLVGKKNIVEITLDENNKEKGSSDKENEVIMVGDSDDEAEASVTKTSSSSGPSTLKCEHCSRNFRQKRAHRTHTRLCPKAPNNARRLEARSSRRNSTRTAVVSNQPKKEFSCKICNEKFDVVVVLARHVKSMHSVKKKVIANNETTGKTRNDERVDMNKINEARDPVANTSTISNATATTRKKRRRRRNVSSTNRGWKGQKLYCTDCAKWFSSAALLAAHCLQHATKKSEKQKRRCQTCKKVIKSRLLFIRHMRMHSRARKLQKKLHHTRQVKLATLRKRGRLRKL